MCSTVRILLVDDHALMRGGIRSLLSVDPEFAVVGETSSGREAIELADRLNPDVVIVDISLSGGTSGLGVIKQIAASSPEVKILILTACTVEDNCLQALDSGAAGYMLKESEPGELMSAVRAIMLGGRYLSPRVAQWVIDAANSNSRQTNRLESDLTEGENRVIKFAALGLTNQEIAEELSYSPKTVEKYRAAAMKKLGLHKRSELIRYAFLQGLMPSPDDPTVHQH